MKAVALEPTIIRDSLMDLVCGRKLTILCDL